MKIAAIILAGGQSSRMGKDKALLPYKGARLVDFITAQFSANDFDIFISGKIDGFANIEDLIPSQGPVAGMVSAILKLYPKYQNFIFCPVDLPRLNSQAIEILAMQKVNCAHFTFEPLPLFLKIDDISREYCQSILNQLASGESVSIKHFIKPFSAQNLPINQEIIEAIKGTNTPQEWENVQ